MGATESAPLDFCAAPRDLCAGKRGDEAKSKSLADLRAAEMQSIDPVEEAHVVCASHEPVTLCIVP